jgi:hypothetical protein
MRFEEQLRNEVSLPDGVRGRDLYIYRSLMRDWYAKLAAVNRYDEAKAEKMRVDWLTYMELVRSRATANYFWQESSDEPKRDIHEVEAEEHKLRLKAIEDGFAHAIGPEAVETLRVIRAKQYDDFSQQGELGPDGYRFRGIALSLAEFEKPVPR